MTQSEKTETFYQNKKTIVIIALICTFLWGSAYPAIKSGYDFFIIAADDIPTKFLFAGYRFTLAGILVIVFDSVSKKKLILPKKKNLLPILCLGIVQTTLQYIFFYVGLANTTGIQGSVLNGSSTFFIVILAHIFYKDDQLNRRTILGCIIGFIGVIIINLNGSNVDFSFTLLGEGFVIIAAIMLAFGNIISKKISGQMESALMTGYQLLFGGIILVVLGYLTGGEFTEINIKGISVLFYLAILSSVAFTLWTQLLKYNKASKISMYNFAIPIFGSVLSALILKESILELKNFISLLLVCIGIMIVNRKE